MINVKPNTCIHVKTQEEYNELMKELEDLGYRTNCFFDKLTGRKMYFDNGNGLVCFDEEGVKNKVFYFRKCGNQKEGYTIEEYHPEFRVGDTVEVSQESPIASLKGYIGKIKQINSRNYIILDNNYFFHPKYLKLIYRAEEPKTDLEKMRRISALGLIGNYKEVTYEELYKNYHVRLDWGHIGPCSADLKESFKDNYNKPNIIKTMTNNIVQFAKNQALKATNPDEFALRTAGLKDQEGNWTAEARQIALDFKAVQLGFKNYDDLINEIGYNGEYSAFELHALFIEFAADLLNIANEKVASEAKK